MSFIPIPCSHPGGRHSATPSMAHKPGGLLMQSGPHHHRGPWAFRHRHCGHEPPEPGANVLTMSDTQSRPQGDVDALLLLNKTGTITLETSGRMHLSRLIAMTRKDLADAAQLSSLADKETPLRGRPQHRDPATKRTVLGSGEGTYLEKSSRQGVITLTAETRMSSIDYNEMGNQEGRFADARGLAVRGGAYNGTFSSECTQSRDQDCGTRAAPALVVARNGRVMGVVE